jgi:hypothetical protein
MAHLNFQDFCLFCAGNAPGRGQNALPAAIFEDPIFAFMMVLVIPLDGHF